MLRRGVKGMCHKKTLRKKDYEKLFRDFSENDIYYRIDDVGWDVYHTHNFYEIMFVLGPSIANCYEDKKFVLCKYDICLIRPEECHKILQNESDEVSFLNIEINPIFVKKFFELVDESQEEKIKKCAAGELVIHYGGIKAEELMHEITRAQFAQTLPKMRQIILRSLTVKLLSDFGGNFDVRPAKNPIVERVLDCMRDPKHVHERFNEICDHVGYSKQYVIRLFRKEMQRSPNMVFRDIKIEYASGLLATTPMSILEIVEAVGYESLSHFNTIFKKCIGTSPLKYRKTHHI